MGRDALDLLFSGLGVLYRARTLYPPGNAGILREAERAAGHLRSWRAPVRITILGDEAVIEDRNFQGESSAVRAFLAAIRKKGCESVRIEDSATAEDLLSWMDHLAEPGEGAFSLPALSMGRLKALPGSEETPAPRSAEAALGYLELLPKAGEALSDLAALKPRGLVQAREIVRSIASQVAAGANLLGPVGALKEYDRYTYTHALNVSAVASGVARALGVEGEALDAVGLAGLCHDVGKERIPIEILNKAGRFDAEERAIMDSHPREGARILLECLGDSVSPVLAVAAYQHHMNADRSGYPRSAADLAPHPVSRVIAVADVYDALRTVRPYREAWSETATCTVLLREGRAGKLDIRYVSALLRLLRVLVPGRRVGLSDGRSAVILAAGTVDALAPTVELDDGTVIDLSTADGPSLDEIRDEAA